MTASSTLSFFRNPVSTDKLSSDSALPFRANRRTPRPGFPQVSPNPLTETLPNWEGSAVLALAACAGPAVIYSLLQLGHLMSGDLLTRAVQAFVP